MDQESMLFQRVGDSPDPFQKAMNEVNNIDDDYDDAGNEEVIDLFDNRG